MSSLAIRIDAPRSRARLEHALDLMLTSGGDERIRIDPLTGRNRYGTPAGPAEDEVWLASSTASAISARGYAVASACFHAAMDSDLSFAMPSWFDAIRRRLVDLFGIPGCEVVLAGSGTEAELIALSLAQRMLGLPLTNIVIAPAETGSGVLAASGGRHFLDTASCRQQVARGERLAGLEAADLQVACVGIRSADGHLRRPDDVDAEAVRVVEAALRAGRAVLAHVLDCSKTGHSGLTRHAAASLVERAGDRILVLVDACQLRCPAERIRADLEAGSMVMITGSKFAGGPPFAGALLLPPGLIARLGCAAMPAGLGDYSAAHDWPLALRPGVQDSVITPINFGAGLRWEAALAELECLARVDSTLRARIVDRFGALVRAGIESSPGLSTLDEDENMRPCCGGRTIHPVLTTTCDGRAADATGLHQQLRSEAGGASLVPAQRRFHVGQPVAVGARTALRICLGGPMIVDAADRFRASGNLDAAMRPIAGDLADLFEKWSAIRAGLV